MNTPGHTAIKQSLVVYIQVPFDVLYSVGLTDVVMTYL